MFETSFISIPFLYPPFGVFSLIDNWLWIIIFSVKNFIFTPVVYKHVISFKNQETGDLDVYLITEGFVFGVFVCIVRLMFLEVKWLGWQKNVKMTFCLAMSVSHPDKVWEHWFLTGGLYTSYNTKDLFSCLTL